MHNRRLKPTRTAHSTFRWDRLTLGVSTVALVFALSLPQTVAAQDVNPVVDLADPNVSVDLSVLNDGGLTPHTGAPMPGVTAPPRPDGLTFQAPGKKTPVSTLHIKPASGFKLPPQSKPIERKAMAKAAPPPAPVAPPAPTEDAPTETAQIEAAPQPAPIPAPVPAPVEVAKAPTPPPPAIEATPEPEPAPVAKATPAPMPEPVGEVAAVTPPVSAPEPEASPEPEAKPLALEAESPVPTPPPAVDAPRQEPPAQVAALTPPKTEEVAPPPPPQAAPTPPPAAPVERDETQTAPKPNNSKVVMPLPPREEEIASLPPAGGPLSDGDSMRIVFDAESSKLPQSARDALSEIAGKMKSQDSLRLQLLAYAGNADTSASAARRLSLSRALAVRSFLIENGVRSTRIDVRALGNKSTDAVSERVDITVVER